MKLRLFLIAPLLMALCCSLTGCRQKETQNELYSRLHTGVVVVLNRYYYQIGLPGGGKLYFSGLDADGNLVGLTDDPAEVERVLRRFPGITVVDEAYIDFAAGEGFLPRLAEFPRLVVLQTFSKAWGGAAIRLGMAFASEEIVQVLNKIKYPYNVNLLTQRQALRMLEQPGRTRQWVDALLAERARLLAALAAVPCIRRVHPTDANFVLVQVADADAVYRHLTGQGIIVRNRNRVSLCQGGLRITVGTPEEDDALLAALRAW